MQTKKEAVLQKQLLFTCDQATYRHDHRYTGVCCRKTQADVRLPNTRPGPLAESDRLFQIPNSRCLLALFSLLRCV